MRRAISLGDGGSACRCRLNKPVASLRLADHSCRVRACIVAIYLPKASLESAVHEGQRGGGRPSLLGAAILSSTACTTA